MITAVNINTNLWNKLINLLLEDKWHITYKYNNFDAGIDSDFVILEKDGLEILFGWDNWFEGEIQCSESLMRELESKLKFKFEFGEPVNLKNGVIELYKKWKLENKWNNVSHNRAEH